ncbi:lysophospholipid acyltransferase family protein [Candidatus Sumerlaeota bacterium]|nr:lysophospholipid acyltransferase family protein [Candidatus Sumerlaeota bacterium]
MLRKIAVPIFYYLFRLWSMTLRIHYENKEYLEEAYEKGLGVIFAFWHGDLFITASAGINQNKKRKIYILTSKSRDGELLSCFLHKFGFGTVRGSGNRGAIGGFLNLHERLKQNFNTALAVDGSQGPRYRVKPGSILLAKTTGAVILPSAANYSWKIALPSWDRCEIPLPFSKCLIKIGRPLMAPPETEREGIEKIRASLEDELRRLKGVCET